MQVVSGIGREIPSPNGGAIRGVIQTDAAITVFDYLFQVLKMYKLLKNSLQAWMLDE